ncbi:glycyl radical diol dehydratase-activating enzyme GrpN, partial [Escherichia coli]|nr:glycyl radical diol dehydratase-activating enzyme GrpN [Escherichia coli]
NRDRCIQCGKCTEICPTRALEMKGKRMSVTAVMRELEKEENLYRRSGGGITLSGGEPLAQPEFARELLKACKAKGWHTA